MNKNLNLVEILKNCPIGTKFYSSYLGKNVIFIEIYDNHIKCEYSSQIDSLNCSIQFRKDGSLYPGGDCMLFPSKEQRDWSKWQNPFVDGDILATDEKKTYHNTRFGFERLLDFEKELPKINKILNMCGYEWDTEKNELKTLQPFKDGDILLNKPDSECMSLLLKNQYDWSIWQNPFVDGDVVIFGEDQFAIFKEYIQFGEEDQFAISKEYIQFGEIVNSIRYYLHYDAKNDDLNIDEGKCWMQRLATEEEKAEFFQALKDKGYKWNHITKSLEKLIEPKFKVGDSVQSKTDNNDKFTITNIDNNKFYYGCGKGHEFMIPVEKQDNWELVSDEIKPKFKVGDKVVKKGDINIPVLITEVSGENYYSNTENSVGFFKIKEQDNWELVPNKFDISTLKPFDKVLVRDDNTLIWTIEFFGFYDTVITKKYPFVASSGNWAQCIPYEGNEHLLGTNDGCDEYYKNW